MEKKFNKIFNLAQIEKFYILIIRLLAGLVQERFHYTLYKTKSSKILKHQLMQIIKLEYLTQNMLT